MVGGSPWRWNDGDDVLTNRHFCHGVVYDILQAVCKEFGVEHRDFATFGACVASNNRYLANLASPSSGKQVRS
jgi:hypothetical protein